MRKLAPFVGAALIATATAVAAPKLLKAKASPDDPVVTALQVTGDTVTVSIEHGGDSARFYRPITLRIKGKTATVLQGGGQSVDLDPDAFAKGRAAFDAQVATVVKQANAKGLLWP